MENRGDAIRLMEKEEKVVSSLILVDNDFPLNNKVSSLFNNIVFIRKIDVKVMQKKIISYQLYRGIK